MDKMEHSCLYEDFVLHPVGEEDPKRRYVLKQVREIIDEYLAKNGKFGTSSNFFIKYADDFCKHKQNYVNIEYQNKIAKTSTTIATAPLSIVPVVGSSAGRAIQDTQQNIDADILGKYLHNNAHNIQNKLNSTIYGWNFKVTSASNILAIEIKEIR